MRRWLALLVALVVAGLAVFVVALVVVARDPQADQQPAARFDLLAFFDGTSVSRGSVTTFAIAGEEFTAAFDGIVEGARLRLEERFAFADGPRLQRWDLTVVSPTRVTGAVATELGTGDLASPVPVEGALQPGGVILDYDGYPPGGGRFRVHFRHVMRAEADGTVTNHVTVSKLGLPIAVSAVTFAKSIDALPPAK